MHIHELRQLIGQEIVDYNQLKAALKDYSHPRRKISTWLQSGELIRIKKGLYVFGQLVSRGPYSIEVLANLIYGPSAISLNYALWYYGLIPEAVHRVTSITNKRNKSFHTPVGDFTYRYLSSEKYAIGIRLEPIGEGSHFLIATPEKAVCDLIALELKSLTLSSLDDFENFLFDDLRIDNDAIRNLNLSLIQDITKRYNNTKLNKFVDYLHLWREQNE